MLGILYFEWAVLSGCQPIVILSNLLNSYSGWNAHSGAYCSSRITTADRSSTLQAPAIFARTHTPSSARQATDNDLDNKAMFTRGAVRIQPEFTNKFRFSGSLVNTASIAKVLHGVL
jgi:hypothetical protein